MYIFKTENEMVDVVVKYAPLVKRIAHHLLVRLPPNIQAEDLIQSGMIGLLEAAKNYDVTKGASFETYAGIRIRGSMLDEVRKGDWAPRSVHRNSRRIAEAIRNIENNTGFDAKDTQIASFLEISLEEYHIWLQDSNITKVLNYEDVGVSEDNIIEGITASILGPLEKLQKEDFKKNLASCIASLPERERLVLALYYEEELNLREVGDVLGVSESRISQIHSQAMLRLQARLKEWSI